MLPYSKCFVHESYTKANPIHLRVVIFVCKVLHFLQDTLEALREKWVGGIRFELSVACAACKEKQKPLHLLKFTDNSDVDIYCEVTDEHILMSEYAILMQETGTTGRYLLQIRYSI